MNRTLIRRASEGERSTKRGVCRFVKRSASLARRVSVNPMDRQRSGFTLLEVVLALGLSGILLIAVYAAIQMHWTYSITGQVEMERSQLARAIFRRIEIDLRSVVFRSTPLSSGNSSTSSSSTSSNSTTGNSSANTSSTTGTNTSTGTGTNTGTASTSGSSGTTSTGASSTSSLTGGTTSSGESTSTQKSGLFGESQMLVLHVSLPSRMASAPASNSASTNVPAILPPGDLQSVAYFLRGSSSALAQQLSSDLSTPTGQTTSGLCRMQGDRAAMQVADEAGDLSSLGSRTKLLAAEVANFQLEFFDGVTWTTSWDSGSSGTLPNAVRITIIFSPPDNSKRGWFARPVSISTDTFSYTVAMPLAEPYVSE